MKKEYEDKSYDVAKLNQGKHAKAKSAPGTEPPIKPQQQIGARKFKRAFLKKAGFI